MAHPVGPHCPSCWAPEGHRPGCPVTSAIHYGLVDSTGIVVAYGSRREAELAQADVRVFGGNVRLVRRIGLRETWRGTDGKLAEDIATTL